MGSRNRKILWKMQKNIVTAEELEYYVKKIKKNSVLDKKKFIKKKKE